MKELHVDEVRAIELAILQELDRICREHNLVYVLSYGTLLGAIRHKGFIPWDDDIDVWMPRKDYERFYQLIESGEVKTPYRFASYRDGEHNYPFLKLIDDTTLVYETYARKKDATGIWVDIFPLEHTSADCKQADLACQKVSRLMKCYILAISSPKQATTPLRKVVKAVLWPVARLMNPKKIAREIDQICTNLDGEGLPENPSRVEGVYRSVLDWSGVVVKADDLFLVQKVSFEDMQFCAPHNPEKVLELSYGDWWVIPPEKDRPKAHFSGVYKLDKEA